MIVTVDSIRVLHVDDEPDLTDLAATFLEREDDRISVQTATSPEEGLSILTDTHIDCLVSDYDMPRTNGIEFLEIVREQYPNLPFILYTGKGSEEIASDAISAGVTDYLQKGRGSSQYTVLANRITNAVEQYRSKQAVTESKKRLSLFFEQSPLGVIEWNEDFRFTRVNEMAQKILGYTEAELLGDSWERIVPESDHQPVSEVVSELLAAEGGYSSVNENVRKDGERIICEWHNRVVTDEDDEVVAIFSQFRDVTDRKQRERELHRNERAMDEAPAGITITDPTQPDNPIIYANKRFEELTGYSQAEVQGRNCRLLQGEGTDPEPVAEMREAVDNEESVTVELRNYRKDGTAFWNRVSITPVRDEDGAVVNFVGFQQDVSDRKEREQELQRGRDALADE